MDLNKKYAYILIALLLISLTLADIYIPPPPPPPGFGDPTPELSIWTTPSSINAFEQITFNAYYSLEDNPIDDATCTVQIDQMTHNMVYDAQSLLYTTSISSLTQGFYQYVITCNTDQEFADITVGPPSICQDGQTESCTVSGVFGICAQGIRTCSNNNWGACVSQNSPILENTHAACSNNQDDDCDGLTDEDDWQDCNNAPSLTGVSDQTIQVDQQLSFIIAASDPENDQLILSAVNLPSGASFNDFNNGQGQFIWTPTVANAGNTYTVTFYATDEHDAFVTQAAQIQVEQQTANNLPPIFSPIDDISLTAGDLITFTITTQDFDSSSVALSETNAPSGMISSMIQSGPVTWSKQYTWQTSASDEGTHIITFTADDSQNSATEQIIISLAPNNNVNLPPVFSTINDISQTAGDLITFTIAAQDFDSSSVTLSETNVPSGMTSSITQSGPTTWSKEYTWQTSSSDEGTHTITFTADDTQNTATEQITITLAQAPPVNVAPVFNTVHDEIADENQLLTFQIAATDANNDLLTLTAANLPQGASFNDNNDNTATFSWTPSYEQSGTYQIAFTADDGEFADVEQMQITINNVNRLPTINTQSSYSAQVNALLTFTVSASDLDSDPLTFSASNLPLGASFTDNNDGTATFSWTPQAAQAGNAFSVGFTVQDTFGATDTAQVSISVGAVNLPPIFTPIDDIISDANQFISFDVSVQDFDSSSVTITDSGLPQNMNVQTIQSGPLTWSNRYTWTPTNNDAGTYTITFTAFDGQDAQSEDIILTIGSVNTAPVLNTILDKQVSEGEQLLFTVMATDADNDFLAFSAGNLPTSATFVDNNDNTGTFAWTPSFNEQGLYTVTFSVADSFGGGDSQDVLITVGNINRPPTLNTIGPKQIDEAQELTFTVTATDPDADTLTYAAANMPSGAVFDAFTRTFSWTPDFTQTGQYDVLFTVTDTENLQASEEVTITVGNVNRAPILNTIGDKQVASGEVLSFTITGSDPDNDPYTFSASLLPEGAQLDENTGDFIWTVPSDHGPAGILIAFYIVDDEGLSTYETITIIVDGANTAPVIDLIGSQSVLPNELLSFTITGSDLDNDPITYTAANLPTDATFTDNNDDTATFSWTPTVSDVGNHMVTFISSDDELSSSVEVLITVGNINRPPLFDPLQDRSVYVDELLELTLSAFDLEGDNLVFSIEDSTISANLNPTSGEFSFTPQTSDIGNQSITFKVTDDGAPSLSSYQSMQITVLEEEMFVCSDGTLYDQCSLAKPSYCQAGALVDKASLCGCDSGDTVSGDSCTPPQNNPSNGNSNSGGSSGSSSSGGSSSGSSSSRGSSSISIIPSTQSGCSEDWECSVWSSCVDDIKQRTCTDANSCGTTSFKPAESESCSAQGLALPPPPPTPGFGDDSSSAASNNQGQNTEKIPPTIVFKTIDINLDQPLEVVLKNDGAEPWTDIIVDIGGAKHIIAETLLPQNTQSFKINVPISVLLTQDDLPITITADGQTLDTKSLPVSLNVPEYGLYADPLSHEGPSLYFIVDNSDSQTRKVGLEAEYTLLSNDKRVLDDFVGPFKAEAGEVLIKRIDLPARYLSEGEYQIDATFYEKGKKTIESTSAFSYGVNPGFNFIPLILLIASILSVGILFVGIDMMFYKKSFNDVLDDMKSLFKK